MPRELPGEFVYSVESNELIETHAIMVLTLLGDAVLEKSYYYASANLEIDGIFFEGSIKETANILNSISQSVDRIEVALQNVDSIAGLSLLRAREQLFGAEVKFGWYRKSLDSGATSTRWFFQGVAAGVFTTQETARVTMISDAYAAVSVGASRKVAHDCQALYKDPRTCAYTGPEVDCDFTFHSFNGCAGRWGNPGRYAHYYGMAFLEEQGAVTSSLALTSVPNNQLLRSEVEQFKPQVFVQIEGASSTNDDIARTTNMQVVNAGFLNVKSFGAKGDGVTDDYQAVLDALLEAQLGTYKTVYFPPGVYNVTGPGGVSSMPVVGRTIIQGAGKEATIIFSSSNDPIIHIKRNALFQGGDVRNLTIRGEVTAGPDQVGLLVDDAPFLYTSIFEDIRVENTGGNGVANYRGFSVTYKNVYMHNCDGYPFLYDSANMPGNHFQSLYVEGIRANGYVAFRIKSGFFSAHCLNGVNTIENDSSWMTIGRKIGVDGDVTEGGAAVHLYDCNIESTNKYGIHLYGPSTVNFYGTNFFALNTGVGAQTPRYGIFNEGNGNGVSYFAEFVPRGYMDDGVNFANGLAAYANNQPIHSNGFFQFEVDGTGPATGGGIPLATYYDELTGIIESLPRRGGRVRKQTISATATRNRPGCGYYEVDSTAGPISLTLEWSGWHQNVQQLVIIKDVAGMAGTNNISIFAGAGGTIGGAGGYVIKADYGAVALMPDGETGGGDWRIISQWPDVARIVAGYQVIAPWSENDWNGVTGQYIPVSSKAPFNNGGIAGPTPYQPVLSIGVDGVPFETYASVVEFLVGRWQNTGSDSRTAMKIALLHGSAAATGVEILEMRSDKSVDFKGEFGGPQGAISGTGSTGIAWSDANQILLILNGNTTAVFNGGKAGRTYTLITQQDATGGRTLTWPTIKWSGGTPGVVSAASNAYDIWVFYFDGTRYFNISSTLNLS